MNFYNPYMSSMPYLSAPAKTGIFGNFFSNFRFSSLISGTQKTLNFINQAIPAIKNISPIIKNAKTMFKVMNEFRKNDNITINKNSNNIKNDSVSINSNNTKKNNAPTFFI